MSHENSEIKGSPVELSQAWDSWRRKTKLHQAPHGWRAQTPEGVNDVIATSINFIPAIGYIKVEIENGERSNHVIATYAKDAFDPGVERERSANRREALPSQVVFHSAAHHGKHVREREFEIPLDPPDDAHYENIEVWQQWQNELGLSYKGKDFIANTPDGRRKVTLTFIDGKPAILYVNPEGKQLATVVPGLNPDYVTRGNKIRKSVPDVKVKRRMYRHTENNESTSD